VNINEAKEKVRKILHQIPLKVVERYKLLEEEDD
jgi:hypothetical protein